MKKQFIPYEQALKLKELGFDEECFGYYHGLNLFLGEYKNHSNTRIGVSNSVLLVSRINAPLWQQAFDWFRTNYNLEGNITSFKSHGKIVYYMGIGSIGEPTSYRINFPTYQEARQACLEKLIEIVEK